MRFVLLLALTIAATTSSGCSKTVECESSCNSVEPGKCGSIAGDCAVFCSSMVSVLNEGNCQAQYNAYTTCLDQDAVCLRDCTEQRLALGTCVTMACAPVGNLGVPDPDPALRADCSHLIPLLR